MPTKREWILLDVANRVEAGYIQWQSDCCFCNGYKAGRVRVRDPLTRKMVRLFNPRRDLWNDHFRWLNGGLRVDGTTPVGRATVAALKMNLRVRVAAREVWIAAGRHPSLS